MLFIFYIISLAVISTSCFILGFYILFRDKHSYINRLFFINSMLLNIVVVLTVLIQLPGNAITVVKLQSVYNIFLILFLVESLYFNLVFTKQNLNNFFKLMIILLCCLIFFIFIFYGLKMLKVERAGGFWIYELINYRFWFILYSPLLGLIMLLMLRCLYKYSRTAELKKEKKQAAIIMIAIFIACGGGFCTLMVFPAFGIYRVPLLTPYFFAIYLYGVFYAMTRFRFMSFSIRDIAYEVLSYVQDIVIILTPERAIMDVNNNLCRLVSPENQFFRGRNFMEIIYPDNLFSDKLEQLIHGKIPFFNSRIIYIREGENIVTDSFISRVTDRFGDFTAILIVSRENRGVMQFRKYFKLTGREMEMVYSANSGLTNKEISQKFKITERTVETHLNNIYNKMGINNKIELMKVAVEFGIQPDK